MKKTILALSVCAICNSFIVSTANASTLTDSVASQLISAERKGTSDAIDEAVSNFNNLSGSEQQTVIDGLNANNHGTITHQLTPVDTAAAQNADAIAALKNTVYVPVKPAQTVQLTPIATPSKVPVAVPVTAQQGTPVSAPQYTPATQLIPTVQQQAPQAVPPRPQSQPVTQLIPAVQQQAPQAVPPRPQSQPVTQLIPAVQQQAPQAVPPRPQSQPVTQLIPAVQQQAPQAVPTRPQSQPVTQLIPAVQQQAPQAVPQVTGGTYRASVSTMQLNVDPISDTERNRQAAETATSIAEGNTAEIVKLQSGMEHTQNTGIYAQSRADIAFANAEANRKAMNATNSRVAENSAELADHESRISDLESSTNAKFGQLKNSIEDNRKRASAGIAGVAAMANIPQVIQGQTFAVGAGIGNTDGESALAVGASARASENVVVKASVSNDTQQNFVVGAGMSYGW